MPLYNVFIWPSYNRERVFVQWYNIMYSTEVMHINYCWTGNANWLGVVEIILIVFPLRMINGQFHFHNDWWQMYIYSWCVNTSNTMYNAMQNSTNFNSSQNIIQKVMYRNCKYLLSLFSILLKSKCWKYFNPFLVNLK